MGDEYIIGNSTMKYGRRVSRKQYHVVWETNIEKTVPCSMGDEYLGNSTMYYERRVSKKQ